MDELLEFRIDGSWMVDDEVYSHTDFVNDYVDNHRLPYESEEFSSDFVEGLESFANGSREDAFLYCLGVGAREAYETTQTPEDVRELNSDAVHKAIDEDRGLMSEAGPSTALEPGNNNPRRETEDISAEEMFQGIVIGFEGYRKEQLDRNSSWQV